MESRRCSETALWTIDRPVVELPVAAVAVAAEVEAVDRDLADSEHMSRPVYALVESHRQNKGMALELRSRSRYQRTPPSQETWEPPAPAHQPNELSSDDSIWSPPETVLDSSSRQGMPGDTDPVSRRRETVPVWELA